MNSILLFVYSLLCFVLIGSIMVQRGTGADMGGGFGGGASQTVFGSQGSASFLTRATAVLATLFFISCLVFAYMDRNRSKNSTVDSIMNRVPITVDAPAVDAVVPPQDSIPVDVPEVDAVVPPQDSIPVVPAP